MLLICGAIACLKCTCVSRYEFCCVWLKLGFKHIQGGIFKLLSRFITLPDCVWPCFNCSEPKHRNFQLHNAIAATNVLPMNLDKFLRELYKCDQGCWRHPMPNLFHPLWSVHLCISKGSLQMCSVSKALQLCYLISLSHSCLFCFPGCVAWCWTLDKWKGFWYCSLSSLHNLLLNQIKWEMGIFV